jgi:hypothetical protein
VLLLWIFSASASGRLELMHTGVRATAMPKDVLKAGEARKRRSYWNLQCFFGEAWGVG